jgi:predicted alpha/beta superfamily hydrolase
VLRPTLAISTLLFTASVMAQSNIHLEIRSLPSYHPSGADVYAAGSFNGWNPQDEKYKFQRSTDGHYYLDLKLDKGLYEYKITRGGWDKAECKTGGAGIENRVIKVEADTIISITIEEWADRFPGKPRTSTAGKNVHIIDTAFVIPQLKRVRRIWVYLPEGYAASKKHYPVLYMHDGQNVFDDATSYSGEWGVDEFLDSTKARQCIVVAIDHGGSKRMTEYNPYDNDKFGKGEGDLYVDFLVKTLKPYIDKEYRTLKDKPNTFIAGSSLGGLISLYAELKYPEVFGAAGVFSPAFWIGGTKIYDDIKAKGKKVNAKIYFYGGKLEGETMIPDMQKAFDDMGKVSRSKMQIVIRDDGKHNEENWRREFPLFYEWVNPQTP